MYSPRTIVIRTDSSSTIGTGHVMRDLVLASQYPNDKIIFATLALKGNIDDKIKQAGYEHRVLPDSSPQSLKHFIRQTQADTLVIDHYEISYQYEQELKRTFPHVTLFVLDDMYKKHYCDMLLNHNIYADAAKYQNLVPKECTLFCGSRYTLLRDEFYRAKKQKRADKKLFVAMGGNDVNNYTPLIVKALLDLNIEARVVTTGANPSVAMLQRLLRDQNGIELYIDSTDIAGLMASCEAAVVSASTVLNEVMFMGLAFLAVKTAPNQEYMCSYLREKGELLLERMDEDMLHFYLKKLTTRMDNNADRKNRSK